MLAESLSFTKGTVITYYSLCKNEWNTTCLSVREFTLLLLAVFICKYTKVLWQWWKRSTVVGGQLSEWGFDVVVGVWHMYTL